MVKLPRSFTKATKNEDVEFCPSFFSSLKLNSLGGSKSKKIPFQAHFLASRRLVDSLHMKPKQVEAKKKISRTTLPSEKLLKANRRMEAIENVTRGGRIIARENDDDRDLLAAITKADYMGYGI